MTLKAHPAIPFKPKDFRTKSIDAPGYWTVYDFLSYRAWHRVEDCPEGEHPIKRFDRYIETAVAWSRELSVEVYREVSPPAVREMGRSHTWSFQRGILLAVFGDPTEICDLKTKYPVHRERRSR